MRGQVGKHLFIVKLAPDKKFPSIHTSSIRRIVIETYIVSHKTLRFPNPSIPVIKMKNLVCPCIVVTVVPDFFNKTVAPVKESNGPKHNITGIHTGFYQPSLEVVLHCDLSVREKGQTLLGDQSALIVRICEIAKFTCLADQPAAVPVPIV